MANKLNESVEKVVAQVRAKGVDVTSEEVVGIAKAHAAGAAAATMAAGALVGIGSTIAVGIQTAFVWSMYYRLCTKLGLEVKKQLAKSLGSAFIAEIAGLVASQLIIGTVISIVPGIGLAGCMIVVALMGYSVTYYSAILFLNLLFRVFQAGKTLDAYSKEELRTMIKREAKETSFSDVKQEAKQAFKNRKEDGVAEVIPDEDNPVELSMTPAHPYWLHVGLDFGSTNSVMAWRLYKWTQEDGWQPDAMNNRENNILRCPTMLVYKQDNPSHSRVQAMTTDPIVGKEAENLANDMQEPAVARTNFKPVFYDAQEGSEEQEKAIELVTRFMEHMHGLYQGEILACLPDYVRQDMCITVHLSTPVRAEKKHRDRMAEIAEKAGFTHDGERCFIDTSRNEAECVMHYAVNTNIANLQKLNDMGNAKSALNLLFIDVGGSTTDIELIKQEFHTAGKSTQVLAMWPKSNVQYMLGGCEVDRAIFDYLLEKECLIPRFAQACWDHGAGKTLFRKLKENNNEALRAGNPINSLGTILSACGDPDQDERPAQKYKDHLITQEVYEKQICAKYINSLCQALHDVLDGKVGEDEVDGVFLTGAGSCLYFIHDLLLGKLGENPLELAQIQADEARLFDQYKDPAVCCAQGAISGVM